MHRSLSGIIIPAETSVFVIVVWYAYLRPSKAMDFRHTRKKSVWYSNIINLLELSIALAVGVVFFQSRPYSIPEYFFVLLMGLYFLLFIEIYYFEPKISTIILKLIIVQFIAIEIFAFLFPSVGTTDDLRDFFIATLIVRNGGGLPHVYTSIIWYDFSPIISLIYAVGNLVTAVPLLRFEQITGFVISFTSVLGVGALSLKFFRNSRKSMLSMWVACLLPFFWQLATWPLPELLAVLFAILCILVIAVNDSQFGLIPAILFAIIAVLTHGGLTVELIAIAIVIYIFTRNRLAGRIGVISTILLLIYSVYVYVGTTTTGLVTLLEFIRGLITPGKSFFIPLSGVPSPGSLLILILQRTGEDYWWIFIGMISWIALLEFLKTNSEEPKSRIYLVLMLIMFFLFIVGISLQVFPVAQGQSIRYVSLLSYPVLCIPVGVGLDVFRNRLHRRYLLVLPIIAIFILAAVSNVWVSPILWQDVGQNSYSGYRMVFTTTVSELDSQSYVSRYDKCYVVAANYLPSFVNLTSSCPSVYQYQIEGETYQNSFGVDGNTKFSSDLNGYLKISPPYLVLFSERVEKFNPYFYSVASPFASVPTPNSQIVFSDGDSVALFMYQSVNDS